MTAGKALIVLQYVLINTLTDLCAGNAASGCAKQSAKQCAGYPAQGDTSRSADSANGTSNAGAGKCAGGTRNCSANTADYRPGIFVFVATNDFTLLTRWA